MISIICTIYCDWDCCADRYEERFLIGAFGQVTYELIFFDVQKELYGTYVCHIVNNEGTGSKSITLAGKQFSLIVH